MSRSLIGGITNRVLMLMAASLLVLSYASAFVNPAKAWYMMLPGLFFFPLAVLNLFLLLWALFRRSKAFVIPLVALVPTLFFAGRSVRLEKTADIMEGGMPAVKMVSYNVGRFSGMRDRNGKVLRDECKDSVFSFLTRTDADIICLQEYYVSDPETLRAELSAEFPGYDYDFYVFTGRYGCFGNVTLSRFPIADQGVVKFSRSANLALFTDIEALGQRFRLYNCHFESYNISFPGIVKAVIDRKDGIWKETGEKMRHSLSLRPKQVEQVLAHISDCKTGTVLCGDFNDTPMSYTYQRLIRGHKDTFRETGNGFGATYRVLWPALRIDYVFIPEDFTAEEHSSPRILFSDHYPVIAGFAADSVSGTAESGGRD